jgi:hypothetical protein
MACHYANWAIPGPKHGCSSVQKNTTTIKETKDDLAFLYVFLQQTHFVLFSVCNM